ncbi:23796_t:CDS:2 [Gigaspora margarita]|uniref:23796_t:CDS:1 n=1 Tax=Gigaspora margarita TaxID=4874 RepID=A0ABM8W6V4_GIGMA|nr:23796_t:CDS:2 [Gigaspora margarita]
MINQASEKKWPCQPHPENTEFQAQVNLKNSNTSPYASKTILQAAKKSPDNLIGSTKLKNCQLFSRSLEAAALQVEPLVLQKPDKSKLEIQQIEFKDSNTKRIMRMSQIEGNMDLNQQKLKKSKNGIKQAHEANQFSETNMPKEINNNGQPYLDRDNGSNRVNNGKESDNYYFGKYNSDSKRLIDKAIVKKALKKELYKIGVEMSEPSEDERVAAIVGRKKKEIFQSQEALDKACKAWLKKVSCSKQMIKAPNQQDQESKVVSSFKLAILRHEYKEETEVIRGARIRTSGCLVLQNAKAELEVGKILNS